MKLNYVESNAALSDFCTSLGDCGQLAMDTEFERRKTYWPNLALIQFARLADVTLVDPLRVNDSGPLRQLFSSNRIQFVMHAPDQDQQALAHYCSAAPLKIFDTQLAAAFLGFDYQISYQKLVAALLDVTLGKDATLSDWMRRELTPKQMQYAIDDVLYLPPLRRLLQQKLEEQGRLEWFREESATVQKLNAKKKLKPVGGKLRAGSPAQRGRLLHLLEWREQEAMRMNLPRQWLISDDCLVALSASVKAHGLVLKQAECRRRRVRPEALQQALEESRQAKPQPAASAPITPEVKAAVKEIQARIRHVAKELNINPTLIASRRQIIGLANAPKRRPAGWRAELLDRAAGDILSGL